MPAERIAMRQVLRSMPPGCPATRSRAGSVTDEENQSPMLDQLAKLGLAGMAQAFAELEACGEGATLTRADWLGLLVDREMTHRRDKRLAARLRYAWSRHQAVVEDINALRAASIAVCSTSSSAATGSILTTI